jgi:hypothetical protein
MSWQAERRAAIHAPIARDKSATARLVCAASRSGARPPILNAATGKPVGATCIPSPSKETEAGRRALAADPTSPGSLGIAASETLEAAATDPEAFVGMSSVLNFAFLHHTVVGLEALIAQHFAEEK